jgi:hypothetical protein
MIARENPFSNKLIKLYLSTYDDQGFNFLGMEPADLFKHPKEYEKLSEKVKKLVGYDCYCSILVEAIKVNQHDIIYRIIGSYENNI